MLAPLSLTAAEVATLDACGHRARHPRQRRRTQALLGHHRGQSLNQLAAFFAVRYATVHGWLKAWRDHGLAAVCEGFRPGRPPKLPPAAKKKGRPGSAPPRSNAGAGFRACAAPLASSCT